MVEAVMSHGGSNGFWSDADWDEFIVVMNDCRFEAEAVGTAYCKALASVLTPKQLKKVRDRNARWGEAGCCASYDFIDADALMLKTMYEVGVLAPNEKFNANTNNKRHFALSILVWQAAVSILADGQEDLPQ